MYETWSEVPDSAYFKVRIVKTEYNTRYSKDQRYRCNRTTVSIEVGQSEFRRWIEVPTHTKPFVPIACTKADYMRWENGLPNPTERVDETTHLINGDNNAQATY